MCSPSVILNPLFSNIYVYVSPLGISNLSFEGLIITTVQKPTHGEASLSVRVIRNLDSLDPIILLFFSTYTRYPKTCATMYKQRIVSELCPDIVQTKHMKILARLECVLEDESNVQVTKVRGRFRCDFKDESMKRMCFDEEPTQEYYDRLLAEPMDWSRHIGAVEALRKQIEGVSFYCNPYRRLSVSEEDPPCKGCGGRDYIDCQTHYTCKACAVVRVKMEPGLDYRNIKSRTEETGDKNSCNYHAMDPLMSDNFNHQTTVNFNKCKGTVVADSYSTKGQFVNPHLSSNTSLKSSLKKKATKKKSRKKASVEALDMRYNKQEAKKQVKVSMISQLRDASERLHKKQDTDAQDTHIFTAKMKMEDMCDTLGLHKNVSIKAHVLFCKFVRSMDKLPRMNDAIAACLFHALPPKPKVYPKVKKRKTGPYNDSKQRKLKYTKFK